MAAKNRPKAYVKARGRAKGSKKPKAWTKEEIKTLRSGYKKRTASIIAQELRRTTASVHGKIASLRLRKLATCTGPPPRPPKLGDISFAGKRENEMAGKSKKEEDTIAHRTPKKGAKAQLKRRKQRDFTAYRPPKRPPKVPGKKKPKKTGERRKG